MAFMNQERKKGLAPGIKAVLKKYGVKATLAVRHHSTLICNVKSGPIDFQTDYVAKGADSMSWEWGFTVNPYWIGEHWSGKAKDFLLELKEAMSVGNWDRSDIMTDYFDVGWYVDINLGGNDHYELVPA